MWAVPKIRILSSEIRFLALGAVRRGDDFLVEEAESPETGATFYRLLGGGVEFDEHSQDAVVREFDEELSVEFTDSTHVGTFEQVFTFAGETQHEIWRVYEGRLVEAWPYEQESFTFTDPELDTEHRARWMPVEALRDDEVTFYVPAILDALGM